MMKLNQFDQDRTFGVEIEAFGVDRYTLAQALNNAGVPCVVESYNHTTRNHWKVVTDASVFDNYGRSANSFELVSPPLKGADGLEQVKRVCEILGRLGAKVNKTCGLHIHHDARDYNRVEYFKNLVKLYGRMERWLDGIMPKSRRGNDNQYCMSLAAKLDTELARLERCETAEEVRAWMGTRYLKVNFESWWRQGTIEFRHHSGSIDAEKIVNWIVLTQLILRKARTTRALKYESWSDRAARYGSENDKRFRPWFELGMKGWDESDTWVRSAITWSKQRKKHFEQRERRAA